MLSRPIDFDDGRSDDILTTHLTTLSRSDFRTKVRLKSPGYGRL